MASQSRAGTVTASPGGYAAPMRVSFLVPAYNEAATISEVLERVAALDSTRR